MRHDLRYTSNTVFDTFPWPQAPSDGDVKKIVIAAGELLSFRKERVSAGIPLGQQYSSLRDPGRNPLKELHERLDEAVFTAYRFDRHEDVLEQLLALNFDVASEWAKGREPRGPGAVGLLESAPGASALLDLI